MSGRRSDLRRASCPGYRGAARSAAQLQRFEAGPVLEECLVDGARVEQGLDDSARAGRIVRRFGHASAEAPVVAVLPDSAADACAGRRPSGYPPNSPTTVIVTVTHTAAPSVIQMPTFAMSRMEK